MEIVAIKDLYPGLKNVNVIFIVLEVGPVTLTKENREVRTFKVADQSAAVNVSVWDEPGKLLMPGDIVRLTKGYVAVWRQCLTLYSGKNGEIQRLGDFCFTFNEMVNMSEPNPNLTAVAASAGGAHGNGATPGGKGGAGRQQAGGDGAGGNQPGGVGAKVSQGGGRFANAGGGGGGGDQSKSSPKNAPRTGRSGQSKGAAAKNDRR
ncbi:SOSS complex subunit B homolog [Culex quinquefasciatus]|uniref:SOSS complex subunit B homolog n=1 Tax=Culex pipiens TaxID=7175 RepID=A0A8D8H4I0_CULPI|nr:SOSS complex subunit B homolog [Culex quinquefasciatus]